MQITLPTGCGNAPRIEIVAEVVARWARGDTEGLAEWLTEDASWTHIGEDPRKETDAPRAALPAAQPERLVFHTIITHGRLASCDGFIEAASARTDFSHVLRFASTAKSARVAELRSYLIETNGVASASTSS